MSTNHPVKTIFSAKSAFKPLSESRNDAPVSESVHGCDNSPLPPTKKVTKQLSSYSYYYYSLKLSLNTPSISFRHLGIATRNFITQMFPIRKEYLQSPLKVKTHLITP